MVLSLLLLLLLSCRASLGTLRDKFEARFNETCNRYPFVEDWYSQFERQDYNDSTKYAIAVFFENKVRQGGLGDKLAGVMNIIAYALRTGRVLLMQGDEGFEEAFHPKLRPSSSFSSSSSAGFSWKNRSHFNLKSCCPWN